MNEDVQSENINLNEEEINLVKYKDNLKTSKSEDGSYVNKKFYNVQ